MKNLLSYILLFSIGLVNAQEKKQTIYYANGNKHYEYKIKNGLLTGGFTCYYENGRIMMTGRMDNNSKDRGMESLGSAWHPERGQEL